MLRLVMKVVGKKQIRCIRCKMLAWVSKDHHWLKPCPKCQEKIDGITYIVEDTMQHLEGI